MKKKGWYVPDDFDRFGFKYGPVYVTRMFQDKRYGYVIQIATDNACIWVHASAKGKKLNIEIPE